MLRVNSRKPGLLLADLDLKRVASTNGGELAGPCPFCGGRDRLRAWPNPREGLPRFWCRQCGASGLLKDAAGSAPAGKSLRSRPRARLGHTTQPATPPNNASLCSGGVGAEPPRLPPEALDLVRFAADNLEPVRAGHVIQWLEGRGIPLEAAREARLGFHEWGDRYGPLWVPGDRLVIPIFSGGQLVGVKLRRGDDQEPRYVFLKGSRAVPLNGDLVREARFVIVVEAELDAIAIGWLVRPAGGVAVSTGSASAGHKLREEICRLEIPTLIALDADDAGDLAASEWLRKLPQPQRARLRPVGAKDPGEMAEKGTDLRAWIAAGLRALRVAGRPQTPPPPPPPPRRGVSPPSPPGEPQEGGGP